MFSRPAALILTVVIFGLFGAALVGPSCTAATPVTITINPSITYQVMNGWEATDYAGEVNSPAFPNYKDTMLDLAVNDVGIDRIRLGIGSSVENHQDYWTLYNNGQIDYATWRCVRYSTVNDDADPNHIDWAGFHFGPLDQEMDTVVLPMKRLAEARNEKLYILLEYVAFTGQIRGPGCDPNLQYIHSQPEEYAEFMLAASLHLKNKYNVVPDAWEVLLEPDNVREWNGTLMGRAIKATAARLEANGFTPRFVVPSTTSMAAAPVYFDAIAQVLGSQGVSRYVEEISYHRYTGVNDSDLQGLANRAVQYGTKTSMLEWWNPVNGYETLHKDLKMGRNSAWQQETIRGMFDVNETDPNHPVVHLNNITQFTRQYFKYVRRGATRIEATSQSANVDPLAFVNTDGRYVVVAKAAAGGSFSVQGLPAGSYGIKYTTSNHAGVDLPDVTISEGKTLEGSIPGTGVITVYGKTLSASTQTPQNSTSTTVEDGAPIGFHLGFQVLADQIPDVAGDPIEAEHYGPNGDSLQQTTTGLMVWRKADNWTAFTNGSRTWVNGPFGVQERGNDERFDWESS